MLDDKVLARIRRCYEDYSPSHQPSYRAFFLDAHANMGLLLDEVDRLRTKLGSVGAAVETAVLNHGLAMVDAEMIAEAVEAAL